MEDKGPHRVRDGHVSKAVHHRRAQLVHDLYHGFVIILEDMHEEARLTPSVPKMSRSVSVKLCSFDGGAWRPVPQHVQGL